MTTIIFDSFLDNKNGWKEFETNDYAFRIANEGAYLENRSEKYDYIYNFIYVNLYDLVSFQIKLNLRCLSLNNNSWFGIIWGFRGNENFNAFNVVDFGWRQEFEVLKIRNQIWHTVDENGNLTPAGFPRRGYRTIEDFHKTHISLELNQYHTYKVYKTNNHYIFYIDNIWSFYCPVFDEWELGNKVGFLAGSKTKLKIQEFVVEEFNDPVYPYWREEDEAVDFDLDDLEDFYDPDLGSLVEE